MKYKYKNISSKNIKLLTGLVITRVDEDWCKEFYWSKWELSVYFDTDTKPMTCAASGPMEFPFKISVC